VKAALGADGVTITWNGLTPTSRTDIIQYEITRAVVGSDYAHSYTHAQLPFVGGQATYSWTDTEVHDTPFSYWVIAQNSTGWSAPSNPASITGAASLVYSNGQAVEALRPRSHWPRSRQAKASPCLPIARQTTLATEW
jgi:hypothetical protein